MTRCSRSATTSPARALPTSTSSCASPPAYRSRQQFLTELTLDPPAAAGDEAGTPLLDEDYLILSTIHSAKGQEWRAVYVLHVVDGCIPSDMATGSAEEIEEERRLLYVAMTRAQDQLHLIQPRRFYVDQPGALRRPLRHGAAHALHPGRAAAPLRPRQRPKSAPAEPQLRQRAALAEGRHRRRAARDVGLRLSASGPRIQPSILRTTGSSGSPDGAPAEHDVEHAEQADHRIEAVLAIGIGAEAVPDLGDQRSARGRRRQPSPTRAGARALDRRTICLRLPPLRFRPRWP